MNLSTKDLSWHRLRSSYGMMSASIVRTDESRIGSSEGLVRAVGWRGVLASPLALVLLATLATGYLAVHLLTLERSPLPWFDDTYFGSVTDSVMRNGEFKLTVSPLFLNKPVYLYGPAYFTVTSLLMRVFPFEVFAFRLPCLAFSLGVVVLAVLILRRYKVAPSIALVTGGLLALDPTLYKSSHSGRMDSMALFFILLSFLTMPERDATGTAASIQRAIRSGVAAGLAVLTTPRPAYLLVVIGCIYAFRVVRERSLARAIELLVWGGLMVLLYSVWLFYAFGSVGALFSYYGSFASDYLGGFWIRLVHVPVLVALLALSIATRGAKQLAGELIFFVGAGIVGFYVLVREWGVLYSFFMVVPAYIGIGYLAAQLVERNRRTLPLLVFAALLAMNLPAYLARNAFLVAQWSASDSDAAHRLIESQIPPGSRVVGDDKYFFAVRRAGSEFQYVARGGTVEERVVYHRDVYDAQYLITDLNDESPLIEEYTRAMPLSKAASLPRQPPGVLARAILRLANIFNFGPDTGYAPTVWVRQTRLPNE